MKQTHSQSSLWKEMRRTVARVLGALCLLTTHAGLAKEEPVPSEESALEAERDQLITKIYRGIDVTQSITALGFVMEKHRKHIAEQTQAAEQKEQKEALRQAVLNAEKAYLRSLDYTAGTRCHLTVDPKQPHHHGHVAADWGKVVRRAQLKLPSTNATDDEQEVTMYEVLGQRDRHLLRIESSSTFKAEVGNWVFTCGHPDKLDRRLPAPWNGPLTPSDESYLGVLLEPPRIASKGALQPIHLRKDDLWRAIRAGEWKKYPAQRNFLVLLPITAERADGRYEAALFSDGEALILEAPPSLKNCELLKRGRYLWLMFQNPRVDVEQRALLGTLIDVEERYLLTK
jgi:hypothetical protein